MFGMVNAILVASFLLLQNAAQERFLSRFCVLCVHASYTSVPLSSVLPRITARNHGMATMSSAPMMAKALR